MLIGGLGLLIGGLGLLIGGLWRSVGQRGGFEVVFSLGVFLAILDIGDQRPGFFFWWLVEIDESALFLVVVVGGEFGCGGGCQSML